MRDIILKDSRKAEHVVHPATKLTTQFINLLFNEGVKPKNIMDLGCGSGLLSIYMAKTWPETQIIASDISDLAISELRENIKANGVEPQITGIDAAGFEHEIIGRTAPYDLIVANIVAKWHIQYVKEMAKLLKADGHVILSGIQAWQLQEIEQAIGYAGLDPIARVEEGSWLALLVDVKIFN